MMQGQLAQTSELDSYIDASNAFYQELFGYKPEQTFLQQISELEWNKFAMQRGLNPNSSGIYLPRNQTSIIQEQNLLALFHEYFGHGLYCEKSQEGEKLIKLERKLLEEEKQEFSSGKFSLEDLQRFRQGNLTFRKLNQFKNQNLRKYELFAIWTEYLLSKEHGLINEFEKQYDSLNEEEKESICNIINFSEQYGNLATFYAQGMARRTTPERVKRLLEDIYKDKLKEVKFALLYGSKKEFSDIDVFMVGDEIPRIRNDWIDIVSYSFEKFEEKKRLFDVEVTDPLFSGEIILGNKNYFEQQKQILREKPITEEAINYNLKESERLEKASYEFSKESEWRQIGLSYALTSILMAENLKKGKRIFTKEDLILHSPSETNIELKGGKK